MGTNDTIAERSGAAGLAPAIPIGFASAVLMWAVWFVLHLPAIQAPAAVTGPVLLAVMLVSMAAGGWLIGKSGAIRVGLIAGLLCAAINLLLLGSKIVEQPDQAALSGALPTAPDPGAQGLRPQAFVIVLGFLFAGAAIGTLGAAFGSAARGQAPRIAPERWNAGMAWVAAAAFLPLLLVGGLVTSARAGMAVPDWPNTYGANMFLYPISLMSQPHIYLEHTHRLFGALVGLATLASMLYLLVRPGVPGAVKALAVATFILVCVQGVLGGLRVTENRPVLAALHGVMGQMVFALAVWTAARATPAILSAKPMEKPSGLTRGMNVGLVHALFVQLAFGALYRHLHQPHALWSHVGFAFVVTGMAVLAGSLAMRRPASEQDAACGAVRLLRGAGLGVMISVAVQFTLGWGALAFAMKADDKRIPTADQLAEAAPVPVVDTLVRTAHQGNGAILLGLATAASVAASRLHRRSMNATA